MVIYVDGPCGQGFSTTQVPLSQFLVSAHNAVMSSNSKMIKLAKEANIAIVMSSHTGIWQALVLIVFNHNKPFEKYVLLIIVYLPELYKDC